MQTGSMPTYQRARLLMRLGRRGRIAASVEVTDRGLLAIAVLVSSILLSTAILVGVSIRESGKVQA